MSLLNKIMLIKSVTNPGKCGWGLTTGDLYSTILNKSDPSSQKQGSDSKHNRLNLMGEVKNAY